MEVSTVKLFALVLVAVGAGVAVTAGALALEHSEKGAAPVRPAPPTQSFVLQLVDSAMGPVIQPANIAVRPGVVVRVTVVNHTRIAHDFSASELGVNQIIPAGTQTSPTTTVFTFTAARGGVFSWNCPMPCGGYMGGHVYAFAPMPAVSGVRWFPA